MSTKNKKKKKKKYANIYYTHARTYSLNVQRDNIVCIANLSQRIRKSCMTALIVSYLRGMCILSAAVKALLGASYVANRMFASNAPSISRKNREHMFTITRQRQCYMYRTTVSIYSCSEFACEQTNFVHSHHSQHRPLLSAALVLYRSGNWTLNTHGNACIVWCECFSLVKWRCVVGVVSSLTLSPCSW